MTRSTRGAYVAIAAASVLALAGFAPQAGAQRGLRIGVAAPPPPAPPAGQGVGYPGYYQQQQPPQRAPRDPRWQSPGWNGGHDGYHQRPRRSGTTVIYVPVPADYGYGYPPAVYPSNGYYGQGYYVPRSYTGVTDANGRPLTESLEPAPSESYGYTPDRSGSPYTVTDESMMVVDFQSGERRAFPSCAYQEQAHDPQGRPRTIFYQPQDYWMVLRPGQRGRVLGTPPAGVQACYAVDQVGRVVLRY
jgi:hypothetical protein